MTKNSQPKRSNSSKKIGEVLTPFSLYSTDNKVIEIPHPNFITHIQFRRFAGCPVCNLHLHSFITRHQALVAAGIQNVVVFHSSQANIKKNALQTPFYVVADAQKHLYDAFGLTASWKALLAKGLLADVFAGIKLNGVGRPEKLASEFITPADFLIDPHGKIIALKYGKHANDQWSVDEVLSYANA